MRIEDNSFRRIGFAGFSWLAAFWSYAVNHSIAWAIFHFFVGFPYIAYRIVFFTHLLPK